MAGDPSTIATPARNAPAADSMASRNARPGSGSRGERPGWLKGAVLLGLASGLLGGLVEGLISIPLMSIGYVPELWYDILWTAPIFDAVLAVSGAVALGFLARWLLPRRHTLPFAAFGAAFVTASIWLGLVMPWQVHTAALLLLATGIAYQAARWIGRREARALALFRRTLPVPVVAAAAMFGIVRGGGALREIWRTANLPPSAPGSPNVLVIVIDALRADHLASNGYARQTSPVLDSLAAAGVSFGAAFSPAPYTAPAHASLLTGLYPHEHGVQWLERRPRLERGHPTIAEFMLDRGYRTGAFSANRFWFTREQGFGRGFLRFEDRYNSAGDAVARTTYGRKLEKIVLSRLVLDYPWRKQADDVTDAALDWIGRRGDRPFFVFLNYFDVHDPYLPPAPYRTRFARVEEPGGVINSYLHHYKPEMTPAQLEAEVDAYDGALLYVDGEIGRLLRGLEERGLADDLLVIVTSDHGEAFGEHDVYVHGNSVYREEIHVPLILAHRGVLPAGVRPGAAVSTASVPATIAQVVGGGEAFRVPSLAPLWQNAATSGSWPLPLSEMEHWPWMQNDGPSQFGGMRSLQDDRYHLIDHDSAGVSLFDWRADPDETTDLASRADQATRVAWLRERLTAMRHP